MYVYVLLQLLQGLGTGDLGSSDAAQENCVLHSAEMQEQRELSLPAPYLVPVGVTPTLCFPIFFCSPNVC